MSKRIALIGFGNMGQALVRGWLEQGIDAASIRVVDPDDRALAVAAELGIAAGRDVDGDAPDVVLLAVKPAQLDDALGACAAWRAAAPLFVSIAAGRTLASIAAALGGDAAIVRAMPNTPAAIGRGMTVLAASSAATAEQRRVAETLMSGVGQVAWIDDEWQMDAVTAVSGSGPAYVFALIESLARAGVAAGLEPGLAERLATATVAGAGAYAESSGEDAAELRRRVSSPGGTTEAALEVLNADDGLAALLERAVRAAAARSRELASS